jgi:hypothetical protein
LKSLVHSAAVFNFDPALLWLARQMYPGAAGIAAMSSTETATAERAFERHGKPRPKTNRELLAQDWANIREGFLPCMPPEVQRLQTTGEEPVWLFSSEPLQTILDCMMKSGRWHSSIFSSGSERFAGFSFYADTCQF